MTVMNDASTLSAAVSTRASHMRLVEFLQLVGGFWRGPTSNAAWTLTVGVLSVAIFEILVQLAINAWNGWFFDILDGRRAGTIGQVASSLPHSPRSRSGRVSPGCSVACCYRSDGGRG